MKKSYFIIYLIIVSLAATGFGVWKYQQHQEIKQVQSENSNLTSTAADKLIEQYSAVLNIDPNNLQTQLNLASAYIQKSRETGDTDYYSKIDTLMDSAERIDAKNAEVYATRGIVALARHHFADALSLGNKAIALNPNKALYYGIVADAYTELGQYNEAIANLQTMVDTRPDYNSFSRIAYARELHGDFDGARKAIQTALEEGASFPENIAWGYVELGKLDLRNNPDKAKQQFEQALQLVQNYTPALEQLGKVAYAQGDNNKAADYFKQAFELLPLAQYGTDLADLYKLTGDTNKANTYYALVKSAYDASAKNGVNTDLEYSLFLSEHDLDATNALELAKKAYPSRPSIYGADVLAWAYYKNNQLDEAQKYITEALKLGENDAHIVYHAAVIAEAKGNAEAAKNYYQKSLALNPNFSILYTKMLIEKIK